MGTVSLCSLRYAFQNRCHTDGYSTESKRNSYYSAHLPACGRICRCPLYPKSSCLTKRASLNLLDFVCALVGRKRITNGGNPAPEKSQNSLSDPHFFSCYRVFQNVKLDCSLLWSSVFCSWKGGSVSLLLIEK